MSILIDMHDAPIIALKMLAGNAPAHLNTMQLWLFPFTDHLIVGWHIIWILTAFVLLVKVGREYRRSRVRYE